MNAITPVAVRRRPAWRWVVFALLLALLVLLVTAAALVSWTVDLEALPVHVVIDGEEVWNFDPSLLGLRPWMIVGALLAGLLMVVVVVPVALAVAFVALAIGLVFGLGVPLLLGVLIAGVALSPLFLLIALGVWLWRKSAAPPAAPTANIAR